MICKVCHNEFTPIEKIVNDKVYIQQICKDCIKEKFGSVHFNVLCESTKIAFDINDEDYVLGRKKYALTKEKFISKYGEEEGSKKWEEYIKKQALTNKYEYKKEKYGWTEDDFKEYNKSRAVTLKNLISKYGEEEGSKKWEEYIKKQSLTKSFDYMVKKYGYEKARNINISKGLSLDTFIRKYGEIEGTIKYHNFYERSRDYFSKISQECFKKIDSILSKKFKTYYATKNGEYGLMLNGKYIKMDYFIKDLNICIEFNGTVFHADPRKYKEEDTPNPFNKKLLAKDIWKEEKNRVEALKNQYNIDTYIIWEDDYLNNFDEKKYILDILNIKL